MRWIPLNNYVKLNGTDGITCFIRFSLFNFDLSSIINQIDNIKCDCHRFDLKKQWSRTLGKCAHEKRRHKKKQTVVLAFSSHNNIQKIVDNRSTVNYTVFAVVWWWSHALNRKTQNSVNNFFIKTFINQK